MKSTKFEVFTLFPDFFNSPFSQSILGRAITKRLVKINLHNIRDFALDARKTVDDAPYGGGAGMVLKVDVLVKALESLKKNSKNKPFVVVLDPKGKIYNQKLARKLAERDEIVIFCGRYEGIDERFTSYWASEIVSVGDYILSGGEPAALIIIDSIARLKQGSLGNKNSAGTESFSTEGTSLNAVFDFPVYTRPESFRGKKVPKVLLSGNHKEVASWRRKESLRLLRKRRPDLLKPT